MPSKAATERYKRSNKGKATTRSRYAEKRLFVTGYKTERGCAVCGETDPVVLDLDHIDPATKYRGQMGGAWGGLNLANLGWKALHAELAKCQVLCANCHRRKTAREQGWG